MGTVKTILTLLGWLPLAQARDPQGARGNANFVTKAGEHFASHFELLGFALGPLLFLGREHLRVLYSFGRANIAATTSMWITMTIRIALPKVYFTPTWAG